MAAITFRTEKLVKIIAGLKAQYSDLMAQAYEFGVNGDGSVSSHAEADKCRYTAQGIRQVWITLEHEFDLEPTEINIQNLIDQRVEELQSQVKDTVKIWQSGSLFIATHHEGDDEFELTRSNSLLDLSDQLKGMQQML